MAKPGPDVANWQVIDADGSGTMDVTELVQASDGGDIWSAKNDYNNDSIKLQH